MRLLAIDPGTTESAYVILDRDAKIYAHGKVPNGQLMEIIDTHKEITHVAVEMIASYGMAVGSEVFETCVWIGRFVQECWRALDLMPVRVYRRDEKLNLCGSPRANDANIRRALIDRFAQFDKARGTGTMKRQDTFYGFAADQWAAMAVGVTYLDERRFEK